MSQGARHRADAATCPPRVLSGHRASAICVGGTALAGRLTRWICNLSAATRVVRQNNASPAKTMTRESSGRAVGFLYFDPYRQTPKTRGDICLMVGA
jgi:hypothetical protein